VPGELEASSPKNSVILSEARCCARQFLFAKYYCPPQERAESKDLGGMTRSFGIKNTCPFGEGAEPAMGDMALFAFVHRSVIVSGSLRLGSMWPLLEKEAQCSPRLG